MFKKAHFDFWVSVVVEELRLLHRILLVDVLHLKTIKNHCIRNKQF